MTAIRDNAQVGFRPGTMQVPGAGHWANNVVAALDDHTANLPNLIDILDQIILIWEETIVHEVMAFDARESESKLRVSKPLDRAVVKEKLGGTAFPDTPCACRFDPHLLVITR